MELQASYATPSGAPAVCLKPFASVGAYWCNEYGVPRVGVALSGERFDC